MNIVYKLARIASNLDKVGKYAEADVITRVAENIVTAGPIRRHLQEVPQSFGTEYDIDDNGDARWNKEEYLGNKENEQSPDWEDWKPDLGEGDDLYFTPTRQEQIAWESAEGGYPVHGDVPMGDTAWKMKPTGEGDVLDQARESRDLLNRYHRRKYRDDYPPVEFASDEEGYFQMPSQHNPPVRVNVTRGKPYKREPYQGYS